jgi:hypothetical protein
MYDKELVAAICRQIEAALLKIQDRSVNIQKITAGL